jgi:hypothetical protein
MRVILLTMLGCLAAYGARAEPSSNGSSAQATQALRGSAEVSYEGFVAGLHVTDMRVGAELGPQGYKMGIDFHVVGMVGALLHAQNMALSQGVWQGNRAVPLSYDSEGLFRGDPRKMQIEYPGGQPHVVAKILPRSEPREPVPEAMQRDTVDDLSAIAYLLREVAMTGRCDGKLNLFDGLRASEIAAHTVGMEMLPQESRSSYSGPALRCDLEGRQIAGFPKDAGPDDMLRRVQHSSVWLASMVPGMPPVPVLMSVEVRFLGHMTIYVTQAREGARLAQFVPRLPE